MKGFLAFLLATSIIVALGDAYCFQKINRPGESDEGCILDGKLYPFGEISRTENCYRCSCSRDAMRCCTLFHTPVGYNKEKCKVVFNKESCNYDVVQKDDPSKECFVYSRVG
ncbi:beta-microseminoprotein isoform X2 [Struthio camelus]|uniref:beta-microseminoprotein isoform X2 n=1 Tax=Struthio camelus TaxID=8801 RepID=UPI00051E4A93|nr:PREDICTED: beta-microseminoprotein [Struthio camelus australis]